MGLFGNRKDGYKEHVSSTKEGQSPLRPGDPKRLNSRKPRFGDLFSDAAEKDLAVQSTSANDVLLQDLPAPTIDMEDFETPTATTVVVKGVSAVVGAGNAFQDDFRKLSPALQSPRRKYNREISASRQDAILRRANSISRMGQRDTIKRSVSRKIARSESRLQNCALVSPRGNSSIDPRTRLSSQLSVDSEDVTQKEGVPSSSSLTISVLTRRLEDASVRPSQIDETRDFEQAYGEDDIFLVEEATHKEFGAKSDISFCPDNGWDEGNQFCSGQQLRREQQPTRLQAPDEPGQTPTSCQPEPAKVRRRPPPLVSTDYEKTSGDPTSDWPHSTVFQNDGGFVTGGFKITVDGMVGRPEFATRKYSESQDDGEGPESDKNLIVVRSLKEFRSGPVIGAGAAGRVYVAEHLPSNRTMAIKVVNVYDKEKRNQLLKELETLCSYVSRYLVRFYGAFYDGSGAVHIALEFMDHGCLATFVQRVGAIPERIVQMIAVDCLRGLRVLHRNHVLHRDFKTANILLSRRLCCAKLSDFGLARDLNAGVSRVETFVGTVAYMSPERLQGSKYTYASDIWAVGVSLVECLLGKYPFDRPQNYFDCIEATMASNMWNNLDGSGASISEEAKDFVMQCTHTEPSRRMDADQLLAHPWIADLKKDTEMFGSWLDHCRVLSMKVPRV